MTRGLIGILTVLFVTVLGGLVWQHRVNATLRSDLVRRRELVAENIRLQSEQRRLQAAQISPEELAERREAREKLAALVTKIEHARRRRNASSSGAPNSESTSQGVSRLSLRDAPLDASEWRNLGDRKPLDAFETALWASAQGDIATLADMITFSETSRDRAIAVLRTMPTALRAELETPEQLVAMLAVNAVPLGSAKVETQLDYPPGARLLAHLTGPDGRRREALIMLGARKGRWRLVLQDAVIAGYLDALKKPAAR